MDHRRPDDAPPVSEDIDAARRRRDVARHLEDDVHAQAFSFVKVVKDPEQRSQA